LKDYWNYDAGIICQNIECLSLINFNWKEFKNKTLLKLVIKFSIKLII